MSVIKNTYGILTDGREVYEYILSNGNLTAHILNYGGIITKLITKDARGNDTDVVLGHRNLDEYIENYGYLGAAIGRFGNRIANGAFDINGVTYHVTINKQCNSCHGGKIGFDKKLWNSEIVSGEDAIILSMTSPDGEEGYPGKLDVKIKYSITAENGIKIEYFAVSDKDTICNLTNHSYFNLNGYKGGKIYNHKLQMDAHFFTPNDKNCKPTGEILSVSGTAFDFTNEKTLGDGMNSDHEQIVMFDGFDHNFVLDGVGARKVLTLTGDKSGIRMEMITNQHGVQVYTSNALRDGANKGDYENTVHDAVCFEAQNFPDCVNFSHFPSGILRAGEEYYHITEYRFV